MIENQSFQSLLQLAVALNIGFAAVATFYGNSMTREKAKIEALFEAAKVVRDLSIEKKQFDDNDRKGFSAVATLRNRVTQQEVGMDTIVFEITRWAAVVCAIASFALLYFASVQADSKATEWVLWGSFLVNIPFLLFVMYAAGRSVFAVRPIRRERERLDTEMSKKLTAVTAT